ncbi:DUF4435 domain-containing protein [Duganella hordei]|uniref:DUF4435 domain-containing protein n=1 Tax=Duganella hordei TaxID=2865934 RepID=UPI0030E7BD91
MTINFEDQSIVFPQSNIDTEADCNITYQKSITIIGANGAGKSRLGTWLENEGPQKDKVHRVNAQRMIFFPNNTGPIALETARQELRWGERPVGWNDKIWESNKEDRRMQSRYGNDLTHWENRPLNDFDKILKFLLSENYAKLLEHDAAQRQSSVLLPMPDSVLRKVKSLWESLLPHRNLDLTGGDVQVRVTGQDEEKYHAAALSDGERVIFYLISQCLSAQENSIIVIDEPELHLHKAIQSDLWNTLEEARSDCVFIYLTHDLDFAADRPETVKIWLREFTKTGFSWSRIPNQQDIPEDTYLEILGSRKPVIFVEGSVGSLDLAIYQIAYPGFTIKPMGGCNSVAQATKGFREANAFHHLKCTGIVDRDYLEAGQIQSLEKSGVYAIKVAEVENILLLPEVLIAMADQLLLNSSDVLKNVKKWIIDEFSRNKESYALEFTQYQVNLMLGRFGPAASTASDYKNLFKSHVENIDPEKIYSDALSAANLLVDEENYMGILEVFNKKNLVNTIDRFFDIKKPSTYVHRVKQMCQNNTGGIVDVIRAALPNL